MGVRDPVLASRTDCLELQGDGDVTSLAWHSRVFGIPVMSEWPSSHCGLNCCTFIWDTDILGVGVVESGTAGSWETGSRRAFTLRNATNAMGVDATSAVAATGLAR